MMWELSVALCFLLLVPERFLSLSPTDVSVEDQAGTPLVSRPWGRWSYTQSPKIGNWSKADQGSLPASSCPHPKFWPGLQWTQKWSQSPVGLPTPEACGRLFPWASGSPWKTA